MHANTSFCAMLVLTLSACVADPAAATSGRLAHTDPVLVAGNPSCEDLGHAFGFKIDPPHAGTYVLPGGFASCTLVTDGTTFDWTCTIGIDAVIAKGGPNASVYGYDPEAFADSGLHAPMNPNTGAPYGLSHVELCLDFDLTVTKTAEASFRRTYGWTIDKRTTMEEVTISAGQILMVPYVVFVDVGGYDDDEHAVSGEITITNPAPMAATVTGVVDAFAGTPVDLDCDGATFPLLLAPGATLTCTYALALDGPLDGDNVVTVTASGPVGGGAATATVAFADAVMTERDACVDVDDDLAGPLGTVCVGDAPGELMYELALGPLGACGDTEVVNTASLVTHDTLGTASDSATIVVHVPCEGCTLTPGYWKTHSSHGPAPYDDTWALLPAGADTPFFLSAQTYHQVLWRAPGGNAYYILAHAFIAAELNALNGAELGALQATFDLATSLLGMVTPAELGALKGGAPIRALAISLAAELDDFNNGITGPGHCDE
jgi:hypothetical protein